MGMTPKTAIRLIASHGQSAEILREGERVSDGAGGSTVGPMTAYAARIFVASYGLEDISSGTGTVEADDRKVLVSVDGLDITPKPGDVVRIAGAEPRIVHVSPVAPGGTVLFWSVQTR